MALLLPHGDLSGMSGLTAAYGYRQLWEAGDACGLPDIAIIVGTSEPWGSSPADWEEAGFTSGSKRPSAGKHTETDVAVGAFSDKISSTGKIGRSIHSETGKSLLSSAKGEISQLEPEHEVQPEAAGDLESWEALQRKNQIDTHIEATLELEVALCTDRWETPLGIVEPHMAMIDKLSARGYRVHSEMHRDQESIEAQLPFLQALRPDIRIVPILVGKLNRKMASRLAADISSIVASSGHSVALIGCTNLGHSGPMYGRMRTQKTAQGTAYSHAQSDSDLADALCAGASSASVQAFNKRAQRANVCGRWTAIVLLLAARGLSLRQGRVLARRMTVDSAQNKIGHAAIIFGPTAHEEELEPPSEGEAPSLIKRASDGTILAGSTRIFTPAERIPKVVPNPEELSADATGANCHSIGDALCYWHEQQTSKCIGVVITLPCFPREEASEKDAEIDVYGSGRNREPKMTPRTTSELSILGASDVSLSDDDSEFRPDTSADDQVGRGGGFVPGNMPNSRFSSRAEELRNRVFSFDSEGEDALPSSTECSGRRGRLVSQHKIDNSSGSDMSPAAGRSLQHSEHSVTPSAVAAVGALNSGVISSSSLNSSSVVSAGSRYRQLGKLIGQRKRMANGPRGVYMQLLPEVRRQGWAVLQLIWPSWTERLDREQLIRFAILAARDAARWILNVQQQHPVALIGWGSSAVAAIEAGARLAWDHGSSMVDAVATLSRPANGLDLGGIQTLPICEQALEQAHRTVLLKLTGAEEYCPENTHSMGGTLQRQAHVTSIASMLSECCKDRENGAEDALVYDAEHKWSPQSMHNSPAWQRMQARFGMEAQNGVHLGDYDGTGDAGSEVRFTENSHSQDRDSAWQPSTTRARSLFKTTTGHSYNRSGHF